MLKIAFAIVTDSFFFPGTLATVNSVLCFVPNARIYLVDADGSLNEAQYAVLSNENIEWVMVADLVYGDRVRGAWQLKTYMLDYLARRGWDVVVGVDSDTVLCGPVDDIFKRCLATGAITGGQDGAGVNYAESGYDAYEFDRRERCEAYISASLVFIPCTPPNKQIAALAAEYTNKAEYGPQVQKVYKGHGDQGILNCAIWKLHGSTEHLPNDIWSQHHRYWQTTLVWHNNTLLNVEAAFEPQRAIHCGGSEKYWTEQHARMVGFESQQQSTAYAWFLYYCFFGECRNPESRLELFGDEQWRHLWNNQLARYSCKLMEFGCSPEDITAYRVPSRWIHGPRSRPRLLVTTVLSKNLHRNQSVMLQRSCEHWGVDLKIMGMRHPWVNPWLNKWVFLRDEIQCLRGYYDIVIYVDGTDTFLQRHPSDAISPFLEMGDGFVIGGEAFCAPWEHRYRDAIPMIPHHPHTRYPNAGMWIADWEGFDRAWEESVSAVRRLMQEHPIYRERGKLPTDDDQIQWGELVATKSDAVKIDYDSAIFFNLQRPDEIEMREDGIHCVSSGRHPVALHSPGGYGRRELEWAYRVAIEHPGLRKVQ